MPKTSRKQASGDRKSRAAGAGRHRRGEARDQVARAGAAPKGRGRAAGKSRAAGGGHRASASRRSAGGNTRRRTAAASARRTPKRAPSSRSPRRPGARTQARRPKRAAQARPRARTRARAGRSGGRNIGKGNLTRIGTRAKWIESVEEHEDRSGQTLATRSHDVIRQWAEARGADPAGVPGSEHGGRRGVLRLNFPGFGGRSLEPIGWKEWFEAFDQRNLVFLYQEHTTDGRDSNFFRLDNPRREDA